MIIGGLKGKQQTKRNYKIRFSLLKSFKPPIVLGERITTSLKIALEEAEGWAVEQQKVGCKAISEIEYETEIGTKTVKIDYDTAIEQKRARLKFKKDKKPITFIMTD